MGYARGTMLLIVVPRKTASIISSDQADFSHPTSRQAVLLRTSTSYLRYPIRRHARPESQAEAPHHSRSVDNPSIDDARTHPLHRSSAQPERNMVHHLLNPCHLRFSLSANCQFPRSFPLTLVERSWEIIWRFGRLTCSWINDH